MQKNFRVSVGIAKKEKTLTHTMQLYFDLKLFVPVSDMETKTLYAE